MDQEMEKTISDSNDRIHQIFLDFMRRLANLDELAGVGHQFLTQFCDHLEYFRRPEYVKTSKLVERVVEANLTDRMKLYLEAGCKHIQLVAQSISQLHTCKLRLLDHVAKAKALLEELQCLTEDAIGFSKTANEGISSFLDKSFDGVSQDPVSLEEEAGEPVHFKDGSVSLAIMMMMMYRMLRLDFTMQENIIQSLGPHSSSSKLESYCLMWDLRPFINDSVIRQAWKFVA